MSIIRINFLVIFGLGIIFQSQAQGPPITVETPIMLGLEGSGIRTFGRWVSTEQSKNYVHVVAMPYNFSPKFQIGAIAPFVVKSPEGANTVKGLGDMTIFAKYQLYQKDGKAKTFRILAKVSQTFPTGNTKLQPAIGAGLFQTYIGLVGGRITSQWGIYGELGYNITNKATTDNLLYNFSVSLPLFPPQYPQKQVNLLLEMNGSYFLQNQTNRFFLSPGLQWIPGRRLLLETSFQQPLFQKEGLTNKVNYQCLVGLRFLIN